MTPRPTHLAVEFRLTLAQAEILYEATDYMWALVKGRVASVASSPEERSDLLEALNTLRSRLQPSQAVTASEDWK